MFQLSLPGGGEDQVQRPEQVWPVFTCCLSQVKLLSCRFNCFLCNFDLCESCVYRKAQRPSLVGNILKTFIFLLPKQTYIMYHLDERVELRKLGKSVLGLEEEQRRNRQSWLFPPTAPVIEEEEPPPSYQQAVTASPLPV